MRPILIVGAGGHAKVLVSLAKLLELPLIGLTDSDPTRTELLGVPVLGDDEQVLRQDPSQIFLVNGIGSAGRPVARMKVFEKFKALGYRFQTLIHPSAIVAPEVEIQEGAQIMAGAVIQASTRIGMNVIVNTSASIDHDCIIGAHTHLAPGTVLSGGVVIGDCSHLGTSAVCIQGVRVGRETVIGAGSVVVKEIPDRSTALGCPAKVVSTFEPHSSKHDL